MLLNLMVPDIISVTQLNCMARDMLETQLPLLWISGELSNFTLAASGHAYFLLKDCQAQVRCVMFRHRLSAVEFKLNNGIQVELKGLISLYETRGEFQINVDEMRLAGQGLLYEAFEQLKVQLQAEGLFDSQCKRPLPTHPTAIGIVTSPTAAALRDVITTLARRMPTIPIILYPTIVQGNAAALQIAHAIRTAHARQEVDVLIICRGGGSLEDLWAFNDEAVARAIADCSIPTISGVGHETDFTICDFVVDQRAPTPTAAAELVSPDRSYLIQQLNSLMQQLQHAAQRRLVTYSQGLDYLSRCLIHPRGYLQQQQARLQQLQNRLQTLQRNTLLVQRWRLGRLCVRLLRHRPTLTPYAHTLHQYQQRLRQATQQRQYNQQKRLHILRAVLAALNPTAVLERGYAIVQRDNGQVVKSPVGLRQRERVKIQLAHGDTLAWIDKHSEPLNT